MPFAQRILCRLSCTDDSLPEPQPLHSSCLSEVRTYYPTLHFYILTVPIVLPLRVRLQATTMLVPNSLQIVINAPPKKKMMNKDDDDEIRTIV